MNSPYCPHCAGPAPATRVVGRTKTYRVSPRHVLIAVTVRVRVCAACGSDVFDTAPLDEALKMAYRAFRKQMGWMQPEETRALRLSLNPSPEAFAARIGCSERDAVRCERGSLQTEAHQRRLEALLAEHRGKSAALRSSDGCGVR